MQIYVEKKSTYYPWLIYSHKVSYLLKLSMMFLRLQI
ncbi:hypothetical protein C8E00_1073 [Chromohalobacter marismortui]|uniref:Uncharacterized protein n=1 Tax=Chromohalobacter marismortui TaxID=42055 RepID=A0A4R7NHM2_9GAMM|nr:hypothetical protein C8E00_1073 [Chromohalobacter marismortui]